MVRRNRPLRFELPLGNAALEELKRTGETKVKTKAENGRRVEITVTNEDNDGGGFRVRNTLI